MYFPGAAVKEALYIISNHLYAKQTKIFAAAGLCAFIDHD